MRIVDRLNDLAWTFGCILDTPALLQQALLATRHYAAWGELSQLPPGEAISADLLLTDSEWAAIVPLAALLVEQENARALEASSNNGVSVYGRPVTEVAAAIDEYLHERLPQLAFACPLEEV